MPRSTLPEDYGPEYAMMLQTAYAQSNGQPYILQLPEGTNITALIRKTYAYFKALRGSAEHTQLALMAEKMTMRPHLNGIVFTRKRNEWDAKAIREALKLDENFADLSAPVIPEAHAQLPTHKAVESPLNRLQEIRAKRRKR